MTLGNITNDSVENFTSPSGFGRSTRSLRPRVPIRVGGDPKLAPSVFSERVTRQPAPTPTRVRGWER